MNNEYRVWQQAVAGLEILLNCQVERVDRLQEAVVSLSGSVDVLARLLGVLANERAETVEGL